MLTAGSRVEKAPPEKKSVISYNDPFVNQQQLNVSTAKQ